jgi:hypothetical protein
LRRLESVSSSGSLSSNATLTNCSGIVYNRKYPSTNSLMNLPLEEVLMHRWSCDEGRGRVGTIDLVTRFALPRHPYQRLEARTVSFA